MRTEIDSCAHVAECPRPTVNLILAIIFSSLRVDRRQLRLRLPQHTCSLLLGRLGSRVQRQIRHRLLSCVFRWLQLSPCNSQLVILVNTGRRHSGRRDLRGRHVRVDVEQIRGHGQLEVMSAHLITIPNLTLGLSSPSMMPVYDLSGGPQWECYKRSVSS